MPIPPPVPYCGLPPAPQELWSRWNFDPWLIGALLAGLALYEVGARRTSGQAGQRAAFLSGWLLVSAALVSPLCALSVALFSARVAQHMIVCLVGGPLVALGRGPAMWRASLGAPPSATGPAPLAAASGFALALWIWHAPGPYAATFTSDAVYWEMHLTLFGTAAWLWSSLLADGGKRFMVSSGAVALTGMQMGILSAAITFASRPLYPPHLLTTVAWNLSPLDDQALGGAIMWAPSGVIFAAALAWSFTAMLNRAGRHHGPRPA